MDFTARILTVILFVVVFVLPLVHIAVLDYKGKVKPFDQDQDSR